eukprot:UC1_evm1s1769
MATSVETAVPEELHDLMRLVLRAFYDPVEILVCDVLLRDSCVKQEDIAALLQLDEQRQVHIALNRLYEDKIVKYREMEDPRRDPALKKQKFRFWYIDYATFTNMVKYRLERMRLNFETRDRESATKESMVCGGCGRRFVDLEAEDMWDGFAFRCPDCGGEVDAMDTNDTLEDVSGGVKLMTTQLAAVYEKLARIDDLTLTEKANAPMPTRRNLEGRREKHTGQSRLARTDASKRKQEEEYVEDLFDAGPGFAVDFGEDNERRPSRRAEMAWSVRSTVEKPSGAEAAAGAAAAAIAASAEEAQARAATAEELALLGSSSEEEEEEEEQEEEEEEEEFVALAEPSSTSTVLLVRIGDKEVPLDAVTEEQLDAMTEAEMEAYTDLYEKHAQ